jgi:predicted esterase
MLAPAHRVSWLAFPFVILTFVGVPSASFAQVPGRTGVAAVADSAAATGRFVDRVYTDADGEHKYVVFEPAGYTPEKKWPVIFYLHGASGRGRDGRAQLVVGLGPAVKARAATLPFLVVFPQNENLRSRLLGGWTDGSSELDRALKILDHAEQQYSVDTSHRILAGVSMGAFGAWSVAADSPTKWKGVIAVSGGGEPGFVPALTKVPVWAFHAADDQLVPPTRSTDLVAEINAAGGRAYVSIVPSGGHNIGAQVLARDEVFTWIQDPTQAPVSEIDWSQRSVMADMTDEVRFVPGADVATAARIRLNRDLLESLSYVMADQVPDSALQGWKPGRYEQQQAGFMTINVAVGGMHYTASLEHAWITPLANGQLRVQLGLRNMTMTITGTQLQSRLINASAGPMAIYIGHREPVWLTIDLRPQVVDRQIKLPIEAVHFEIPQHNWSISRPGVDVRGLPFLADRVADSLVTGIAEKKGMIEQEIRSGIPQMIAQMEQRIATMWERTITYRQWPMPLWQPRFRFYPEAIVVDEGGLELRVGAFVAALAPRSTDIPVRPFPANDETLPPSATTGLDVAVSTRLLDAYSTMLTSSDVARFHVLDMNGAEFQTLGTRDFWNTVLPGDRQLAESTELNTEFVLATPFRLRSSPIAETGLRHDFALEIPKMQLQLATREPGSRDWTDRVHADLAFAQGLRLGIEKTGFSGRRLDLQFLPVTTPEVSSRWVDNQELVTLATDPIAAQFHRGWSNNFGKTERDGTLKDLKLGQLVLRWDELGATESHLVVRLNRPGIRIHNRADSVVEYQVRGTTTPWSDMLKLTPGEFHEYRSPTPLTYRSMTAQGEQLYTLPLGYEAQVRSGGVHSAQQLYQWSETSQR